MLHDELTSLGAQLQEALRGGDPLAQARLAGRLHRAAPNAPALLDARAALTRAYPALPLWLLPQREPPPTSLADLHELVTQFVRAA